MNFSKRLPKSASVHYLLGSVLLSLILVASTAHAQWQQIDKESSPSALGGDFGNAVTIEDNWALVGDPDFEFGHGEAYVYRRDSSNDWVLNATLSAPDDGMFGASVDLYVTKSACRAVVGARSVNIDGKTAAGAAYVYECGNWSNPTMVTASDVQIGDSFGASVSIHGDRVLVGSPGNNGGGVSNAGAAYVFVRNGSSWSQEQKLVASNPTGAADFGRSVSLTAGRAGIGAPLFNSTRGAAYVFDFNGSTWQQQAFLEASDNDISDRNGWSVSISGNYFLTGAIGDDSGASNSGAAYVFKRDFLLGWVQQKKLKASDFQSADQFGFSVFLSGYWAVVGAISEDEGGFSAGAGYIFNRSTCDVWDEKDKIIADDASASDNFGFSVQLDIRSEPQPIPQPLRAYLTVLSGAPGDGNGSAYWHEDEIPAYVSICPGREIG